MNRPTVVITGSAIRLGKATAEAFFARGCNLVLHYNHSSDKAKALTEQFNQLRAGSATLIQADLNHLAECQNLIDQCLSHFGRLDHLINNASIYYPTPIASSDLNGLDPFININFVAPVKLIQSAARFLKIQQGSVVNLIDIYADAGLIEHTFYVAAKAALQGATIELAHKLAPDIRVNGVSPGAILWPDSNEPETNESSPLNEKQRQIIENTALKKLGEPKNIAATICYLALDASYTTGSVIKVDGGRRWYI